MNPDTLRLHSLHSNLLTKKILCAEVVVVCLRRKWLSERIVKETKIEPLLQMYLVSGLWLRLGYMRRYGFGSEKDILQLIRSAIESWGS